MLRPKNHIKLFENDAIALNTITVVGTLATTLGANNPFHYRDYYYDTETGLYYLQTRYYDPEVLSNGGHEGMMRMINLTYEGDLEDADILSVPEIIYESISIITREFFDWLSSTKNHGYWRKTECGDSYLSVGTDVFVKWLNEYYCSEGKDKVEVIKSHVKYNPEYATIDF